MPSEVAAESFEDSRTTNRIAEVVAMTNMMTVAKMGDNEDHA
mgnify:CR=1 FL=1